MEVEKVDLKVGPSIYWTSLIAGGMAGLMVDMALFPIDTIKTRLQAPHGFFASGGFRSIYKGIGPVVVGSAPTAALFFFTYESLKSYFSQHVSKENLPFVHMTSAGLGEIVACLIRVPVEIAKQRRQVLTTKPNVSAFEILYTAYQTEGLRKGVYRGFGTTILREVPFSFIQFPLWEYFKKQWSPVTGMSSTPFSVALCGALAGGISAALTTPLDVVKTRIMLADSHTNRSISRVFRNIYRERGIQGLFAGVSPRVAWISIGGAIFFGFYDLTTRAVQGQLFDR